MSETEQTAAPEVLVDLSVAEAGSWYCIAGVGGDVAEWTAGYEQWLADEGLAKPTKWWQITGAQFNDYVQPPRDNDRFQPDLVMLLFPLDGMDMSRLPLFKIRHMDRWFDDVCQNAR